MTDNRPAPDLDATLVLGMASTAIPFARSREEEAERWLRILRLHGEAGTALQALGVSEAPLEDLTEAAPAHGAPDASQDVVASVVAGASERAHERGAPSLASEDVLRAVMDFYGADFDHVLRAHGTDRDEVLARLELQAA
jgi:hypothetical protein